MTNLKPFALGALAMLFAFSLTANYLFYTGTFQAQHATDEERLNKELAGL